MRFPVLNWSVLPQLRESWCIYVSCDFHLSQDFSASKENIEVHGR